MFKYNLQASLADHANNHFEEYVSKKEIVLLVLLKKTMSNNVYPVKNLMMLQNLI